MDFSLVVTAQNKIRAWWKWLLSLLKRDWELSDYSVREHEINASYVGTRLTDRTFDLETLERVFQQTRLIPTVIIMRIPSGNTEQFQPQTFGATMMAFLLVFLFGCVDGLRSLTPPALVCWAARLGWLHFAGTKLAFINYRSTLIVFTLLAVVELIADKLPNTPARTAPIGLIARICLGGACGLALATSAGISLLFSVLLASVGAIVGAFGGYHSRRLMVSKAHVPDLVVAIAEDAIAIAGGLLILSHIGK